LSSVLHQPTISLFSINPQNGNFGSDLLLLTESHISVETDIFNSKPRSWPLKNYLVSPRLICDRRYTAELNKNQLFHESHFRTSIELGRREENEMHVEGNKITFSFWPLLDTDWCGWLDFYHLLNLLFLASLVNSLGEKLSLTFLTFWPKHRSERCFWCESKLEGSAWSYENELRSGFKSSSALWFLALFSLGFYLFIARQPCSIFIQFGLLYWFVLPCNNK